MGFDGFGFILFFIFFLLAVTSAAVPGTCSDGSVFTDVVAIVEGFGFTWSWAGPEAGYAVVGARAEDMAEWVVFKRPDSVFVSVGDFMGWVNDRGRDSGV